ncbi:sigma-54 dependent transcriptional regulator, Fis family [Myxococcus xanthus DK 1622]|uniref:Sigma-54 dependent transcriptional regulator, Fis family n=1 Tax=Myxococcus xanthus (strain DK1622) TaxID=246197 RepID=Q1D007_MYXXD|nr:MULTISPECIES: sigma-54-dependent Fis family transcriptional regulator [Myxococcus]ABF91807.1 sigma-54 dependent transcriptional regulator, Fis family [Myxococcus xanthus DK 1622]NOJ53250.1 sigma-54-dependent Fis family transcriptional regulator [Myxococcus xanthus]QPM78291.1 sigma-54-dependent Fis family transcriptional regulator [Myxococcus xanthus]QVW67358.1 sigma-54-dependent Fis family transcriptional regulator [Myxococcus xanthus DZ2]QZZ53517.1 Phenol regulator MopR [Myxococcus xanthus
MGGRFELDLSELLSFDPGGGLIHFGGQRVLLMDPVALGLLRKELIKLMGMTAARGTFTRLGYAHGWRTAEAMKGAVPWKDESLWRRAGGRLHTLQGQVRVEPVQRRADEGPEPFAEAQWHDSYEAEQHLLHLGQSDQPVCWSLTGFASGYMSYVNGKPIYGTELRCVGKGDAACHYVGRPAEEWSTECTEVLRLYETQCMEGMLAQVTEALRQAERKLRAKRQSLARAGVTEDPAGMVARSEAMQRIINLARRVAKVDSTVLVTGESGVGKERIARLIHDESGRAHTAFVAVNCAAVTESLLESELFGHARGAFTGATHDRAGLFEAAHGGTLFLDEVGEVPPSMQAKLLRVLQEREVRRVGENTSRKVDVRLVAATNRDLAEEVRQGRFRQDLYYRLRVIELKIPPLRERRDDVLPLARLLLAEAAERLGRRVSGLSPDAADQLLRYAWPGNVRELSNAVERAVALCEGTRVEREDLPEEVRAAPPSLVPTGNPQRLEDMEKHYILAVLAQNGGNRARTAEQLDIGVATLYRKLKQYGHPEAAH